MTLLTVKNWSFIVTSFYTCDREGKRGGGLGIFINKNLQRSFKSFIKILPVTYNSCLTSFSLTLEDYLEDVNKSSHFSCWRP